MPRALRSLPAAQPPVAEGRLEPHPLAPSQGSGSGLITQAITSSHGSESAAAARGVRSSPEGAGGGRLRRLAGRRDAGRCPDLVLALLSQGSQVTSCFSLLDAQGNLVY